MGKFTVTNEIRCNQETFWRIFFDKAFNEELYLKVLGFPSFKIVSQTENDREILRKVAGQPKMNVPGPLAKMFGPGFGYTEEGRFDRATQVWTWKLTPSSMAEKLRNEGSVRVTSTGENTVRRVADITIEAKIFGVGGLIESTTEKQLREGWETSAVFMNKWLAEHP